LGSISSATQPSSSLSFTVGPRHHRVGRTHPFQPAHTHLPPSSVHSVPPARDRRGGSEGERRQHRSAPRAPLPVPPASTCPPARDDESPALPRSPDARRVSLLLCLLASSTSPLSSLRGDRPGRASCCYSLPLCTSPYCSALAYAPRAVQGGRARRRAKPPTVVATTERRPYVRFTLLRPSFFDYPRPHLRLGSLYVPSPLVGRANRCGGWATAAIVVAVELQAAPPPSQVRYLFRSSFSHPSTKVGSPDSTDTHAPRGFAGEQVAARERRR